MSTKKDDGLGACVDEVIVEIMNQRGKPMILRPLEEDLARQLPKGYEGPAFLWSDSVFRTKPQPKTKVRPALVELVAAVKRLNFARSSPWAKMGDVETAQAMVSRALEQAQKALDS